jgi:hypothetical protein
MNLPMLGGTQNVTVLTIVSMASQIGGVNKSQSASAGGRVPASALNVPASTMGMMEGKVGDPGFAMDDTEYFVNATPV